MNFVFANKPHGTEFIPISNPSSETVNVLFLALQVVTVFFVAVTMSLALAHALELPGKLRLDQQTYLAVQTIYYPGFTIGGIGEPLAIIATLILLLTTPRDHAAFWWLLVGLLAVAGMQLVFWLVTQPVNRFWLKNERLSTAGAKFFSVERSTKTPQSDGEGGKDWKYLRDRWEYSHVARAVLSGIALVAVVTAVAMQA